MEDSNQQPHAYGGGQQRSQHSRPFFYVQPPSQPYYVYHHWQLNNPYSHYGLPGAFNFGRPFIHPYQYMQYPGYMFPHAPLYPVDYRRMFEPRFHPPPWGQQHHPQPQGRRETACSEAQTDPSDAISKLIECLDKIHANELRHGADRELDSGVASHSSGMFSPVEERKAEEQDHVLPSLPANLTSPAVVFSDSTTAVYDESSHRSLDTMSPEGCWSGALEEELPLDSSSVHEERAEVAQTAGEEGFTSHGAEGADVQSDIVALETKAPKIHTEELKPLQLTPFLSSDHLVAKEGKITECHAASSDQDQLDPSCRILRLPFESILTPKATAGDPISSASPYFYNYLSTQTTHERMSVLSPSLDELSSREEMFSTDLDDAELFPKTVYTSGHTRLTDAGAPSARTAEETEDLWLAGSKRPVMCACCGKTLVKGSGRSKVQTPAAYKDEAADSEEESRYRRVREHPVRVVVRKHVSPRKHPPPPPPLRHPGKPWYKKGQYRDASDLCGQEEGHNLCKKTEDDGRVDEETSSELQCRSCQDGLCREELTSGDQARWAELGAFPRRRQATPVKRQEMSSQRKVVYHRHREEDNDEDEPPPMPWDRVSVDDMETVASSCQQPLGLNHCGTNPPYGAPPTGTRQSAPGHPGPSGSTGGARTEEQQHHKPFFYVQPSQPYPVQSLQWPAPLPIPVSYSPYYGYAGLGYSMPMMPPYQQNPYMEPPGFVVPHSHLHLMDYRRLLNPQYYQTMAYHSRRFRYQHSPPRVTSSQVQTDPLCSAQRTSTPGSNDTGVSSGISVCTSDSTLVRGSKLLPTAVAVQNQSPSVEREDPVPSPPARTSSNGSFMIQTEEVRIECCTTPVGLQLLHSHETAEVSHNFSQDMVQCRIPPAKQMEKTIQVCPDILLVGGHSSSEEMPTPQESGIPMNPPSPEVSSLGPAIGADSKPVEKKRELDKCRSSEKLHSKVVSLPFDFKCLEELQKIESTVWSIEEPSKPSSDLLTGNDCFDSRRECMAPVIEPPSIDVLMVKDSPTEEMVSLSQVAPGSENMLPPFEGPDEASEVAPVLEVPQNVQNTTLMQTSKVDLMDDSPVKSCGVLDHHDTSFESLPAYLPSSSWLTDFDTVFQCSKIPPTPKKQNKPASSCGVKEQQALRKMKERYIPKGQVDRRSLSDHECCLRRNFNENAFTSYQSKRERLCSRCLSKQRLCPLVSPGVEYGGKKRKALPLQQWNDVLVPTCEACKFHTKRVLRKGSNPDVWAFHCGQDTEGESSETGSWHKAPKWRSTEGPRRISDFKRSLSSRKNHDKFPAVVYPKLKERNWTCTEQQHQTMAWDRQCLCPHGKTIKEIDENCALPVSNQKQWRNKDRFYLSHQWHTGSHSTEKPWKAAMPSLDVNISKNETRSLHMIKHKKSQSQGTHRKDTRY